MTTWPDIHDPAAARALAGLFPPARVEVAAVRVRAADPARLPRAVRDEAPAGAGPGRLRTWTAGRLAASLALARLGLDGWPARGTRGRPSWPAGVHGSISHTADLAVCAVGPADGPLLGVDVERTDRRLRPEDLLAAICRRPERDHLLAGPDPRAAALALLCAKEAVYKALPAALQAGLPLSAVLLRPSDTGRFTATVAGTTARVALAATGPHLIAAAVSTGRP
ncbi:enterobactin synthetase component D [Streptomyces sp. TLI_235]|nr:4'-phosphopantetheinyl transferase superfamily protein [Streptomyces sp. TLI_235]PBC79147.1 enterobactin synthetase component D [Streptomyces sp. TLI_235]